MGKLLQVLFFSWGSPWEDDPIHEVIVAIRRAAQGLRRVRNLVLFLHSGQYYYYHMRIHYNNISLLSVFELYMPMFLGGLASADKSVRRSDLHTILASPRPASGSTAVAAASASASLLHPHGRLLGNQLSRSERNRDLCRIISLYVPVPIVEKYDGNSVCRC